MGLEVRQGFQVQLPPRKSSVTLQKHQSHLSCLEDRRTVCGAPKGTTVGSKIVSILPNTKSTEWMCPVLPSVWLLKQILGSFITGWLYDYKLNTWIVATTSVALPVLGDLVLALEMQQPCFGH